MKTSIVFGKDTWVKRAFSIAEFVTLSDPEKRFSVHSKPPFFSAAHDMHYRSSPDLNKDQIDHYPDQIILGHNNSSIKRGIAQDNAHHIIRVISGEYVATLDEMDGQIEALMNKRKELMLEAMRHGRPLKVSECRQPERPKDSP
jgi:hypothetical protein